MNIAFSTKLALTLISTVVAYSNKINIDDYFRGKYDIDTTFARIDDIKAAVYDPENAAIYPYCDPEVRHMIEAGLSKLEDNLFNIRACARALGNENMKFSEYLLHKSVDLDVVIADIVAIDASFSTSSNPSASHAMTCHMEIGRENMRNSLEWMINLKQRKDAGAQWG